VAATVLAPFRNPQSELLSMCGIGGMVGSESSLEKIETVLRRLQGSLQHRGPDDTGLFLSQDRRAGLVNTRLAILDLSSAGHQPMSSADGRYHIAFNGEIYNFEELRAELAAEGETFHSHSDTEVVLKMFARYGPDSVRELAGMFALAIWDARERQLFLARDPLGIKPLYYHASDGRLLFASEIRALLDTGLVPRRLSAEAVSGYMLFGAVQDPMTLVEGVQALSAGHYMTWDTTGTRTTKFWDISFGKDRMPSRDAVQLVRQALEESVDRHLVSDVPVGVFLSGGIDSTAVLALTARRAASDLRTFSISFADPTFDEGSVAARTAQHFGARHTDWRMDSATAKGLLTEFLNKSDQPSVDGFNTFCVSKLAHDHGMKVVLSGLGGDEVFGGYGSFRKVPQMVKASRWLKPAQPLLRPLSAVLQTRRLSPRWRRFGRLLQEAPVTATAYWAMRGIFTPREVEALLPRYGFEAAHASTRLALHVPPQPTLEDEVSYLELTRYMRNQLLRDSDVMSMAWGLELRVPFVDSQLLDAVGLIPAALRLAHGKQILLDAVREIPEWVRNRRKQGFAFPFQNWVKGEWQDVFQRIEQETPIQLNSWYRCWCLFALDSFVDRNGMAVGK
jgi:asparagine synthase (glutamine-hydrolysing)